MRRNSYYSSRRNNNGRLIVSVIIGTVFILIIAGIIQGISDSDSKPTVLNASNSGSASVSTSASSSGTSTVPWDYRIEEAKVGDLVGADMTILPNNQLLPNDDNYATGDKVWVLSYMSAEMRAHADGQNEVKLSAWTPIKTFRSAEAAKEDLAGLKVEVKTEVDLVGVYKTEYQGKYRQFALLSLPTGHTIKQPIAEDRYNSLKDKKQVQVILEEVHDFGDYDLAMSKFRGWAN